MDFTEDKQLTAIIGKEMYRSLENDILVPIEDYLSKKILDLNAINDQSELSLPEAINYLVNEKRI